MKENTFDLKDFRENYLKMSQSEFADRVLGGRKSQTDLAKIEKNPDKISLELLCVIAERTGMSLDKLVNYKKFIPEALPVKKAEWRKKKKLEEICSPFLKRSKEDCERKPSVNRIYAVFNEIDEKQKMLFRKPMVVVSGQSDAGKSTMINALLGRNMLPTSWTPTTSIVVYLKHIDDRPSYIEDDVWVFKKGPDDAEWDNSRLYDQDYCNEWKIAGGTYEILKSYGTNGGENYKAENVGAAVLFLDSDILKNCDMLDVPGFTGGIDRDNKLAYDAFAKADVLIYLSQCNNFLSSEDAINIGKAIDDIYYKSDGAEDEGITPISKIFIVATQAQIIDSDYNLNNILDSACDRLYSTMDVKAGEFLTNDDTIEIKESPVKFTYEEIRNRFFTYTTDDKAKRVDFEEDLKKLLEKLPEAFESKYIEIIKDYIRAEQKAMGERVKQDREILNNQQEAKNTLEKINEKEPERKERMEGKKKEIIEWINAQKSVTKVAFENYYNKIVEENAIKEIIDKKEYLSTKSESDRMKESKAERRERRNKTELIASCINSQLNRGLVNMISVRSQELNRMVDAEYINEFDASIKKCSDLENMEFNFIVFDTLRAFSAGLAGGAVYGGIASWMSGLGPLGGYILVAKGVSLLSKIGIHVGGVAAAASAVSAIGGPLTIVAGLGVVAAIGTAGVLSLGEKSRIVNKIVKTCKEKNVCQEFTNVIDKYWNDIEKAFVNATDHVEKEWEAYIKELKERVDEYNEDEVMKDIFVSEQIIDYLTDILEIG